ncbi:CHAT domain-containing protein [Scytonema sp. PRP1]|uniref:CHAT domain-containing protein n=1 Tax=Scytonema sp. PRP1 TaxID=3120513 RepID=UPI00300C7E14
MTSTRYRNISLTAFVTLILTIPVVPLTANLPALFQVSQVLAQTTNERKAQADKLLQQGQKQYDEDELQPAIQSFQKALTFYREIKNIPGEIETLVNLGIAYTTLGNCTKTVEYYQQYLAINPQPNIPLTRRNFSEKFQQHFWFKSGILQNIPKVSSERAYALRADAKGFLQQGNELYQKKQFKTAIQPFQKALSISWEIGDYQGNLQALIGLANNYIAMGEYNSATISFQHALVVAKGIKDRKSEKYIQQNFQTIESQSHTLKTKADLLYEQGVKHYQACQQESAFNSWKQVEKIYLLLNGSLDTAVSEFPARILSATVERLYKQGIKQYQTRKNKEAIESWHQALRICQQYRMRCDNRIEEDILEKTGLAYDALENYTEAIQFYQQQLKIYRQEIISGYIDKGEAISLYHLGLALLKSGKPQEAEFFLRQNVQKLEEQRRSGQLIMRREFSDSELVSFFDKEQYPTYPVLQQVLIAQKKYEAALEISEQGRTRIFLDSLLRSLKPESIYQGLVSYVVNPNTAPLFSQLEGANPKDGEPIADLPSIQQIKQIAKIQNATLVEYSIVDSEIYIWVIKPTGEVTFRKADLKSLWQKENTTLADLVINSRKSIGIIDARGRDAINVVATVDKSTQIQRLQQLHKLLIEPIADLLPSKESERVIFIPQNSLFLIPFPALQDDKGKYLIEKHTILTAPSIQVLDLTRKQRLQQKPNLASQQTLIVGNPTMPKVILEPGKPAQQLKNLPWAEKEAKDIASLLKTQPITGNQATKAAVVQKMTQARIIHLATHGLLDDNRGLGSAIALAPSGKDDGLLTAEDILNLSEPPQGSPIRAELVVLSACNTGRGRITGDGVIGLSRSLISAGVPSVIVSLWSVDDNSTSFLMTEFYKNLQQKLDKATALRQAMLTTMQQKKYENPLNWAAFTLIGETD